MGRKKSVEKPTENMSPAPVENMDKPMSKSACIRLALDTLGIDVPYSAVVTWCKSERGIDVTSADIGNVKSALKKKQGGSVSAVNKPVGVSNNMMDLVGAVKVLKEMNQLVGGDNDKLHEMIEGYRKLCSKVSGPDLVELMKLI